MVVLAVLKLADRHPVSISKAERQHRLDLFSPSPAYTNYIEGLPRTSAERQDSYSSIQSGRRSQSNYRSRVQNRHEESPKITISLEEEECPLSPTWIPSTYYSGNVYLVRTLQEAHRRHSQRRKNTRQKV